MDVHLLEMILPSYLLCNHAGKSISQMIITSTCSVIIARLAGAMNLIVSASLGRSPGHNNHPNNEHGVTSLVYGNWRCLSATKREIHSHLSPANATVSYRGWPDLGFPI